MLKRCFIFFAAILLINTCFGQETIQKKNRLTDSVTEVFQVLKSDKYTRQGIYQAIFKKKIVVATGAYANNKRAGLWHFYNPRGTVIESYDYDTDKIIYEAPEDTTSALRYFVDKELGPNDKITKPVKVGGRYYGYIPYLQLFKLPNDLAETNSQIFITAVVELLISPFGRLADYKVHLSDVTGAPIQDINMNINLPNPADKVFIPATLNGEPVSCRIMIRAIVTNGGHLNFMTNN